MLVVHPAMFEKWQDAVLGYLFPPGLRCLDLKSVGISASNRLAWQKNLHQSCIPPFFKQGLEAFQQGDDFP
jgi:hypothetical protein